MKKEKNTEYKWQLCHNGHDGFRNTFFGVRRNLLIFQISEMLSAFLRVRIGKKRTANAQQLNSF